MSERKPYTYLTASIDEGVARLNVAFYTADLQVMVLGVGKGRPTLNFYSAEGELKISTTGAGPVTAADVALARKITDAAACYLAECERLHTQQSTHPDQADESAA
ncbi:hypothetical protein ACFV0L_28480 [Streptosporangium canum]|uniref:hypothetical protein n=1 Tax=Streptosporangium canum TaxID=324952 RepID=UPI0036C47B23